MFNEDLPKTALVSPDPGRHNNRTYEIHTLSELLITHFLISLQALQKMNSGDTPLNTAALLIEKQKTAQSPFVILSGGGQTFSTGWVTVILFCSLVRPVMYMFWMYSRIDLVSLLFPEPNYGMKPQFLTDAHV